ncbi:MAG: GNAT family N-acetyltransferase [Hyphomonas sp.]
MPTSPVETQLQDGTGILLRPVGPADEPRFAEIVAKMSPESRYLRFFTGIAKIPERIIHQLADADGDRHIAWGALDLTAPGQPLLGAAHAIRMEEGYSAELAMGVLDAYQAQGISRMLIACIALQCHDQGIIMLEAETLPENRKANSLFKALGGRVTSPMPPTTTWQFHVGELISVLRAMETPKGLRDVFRVNGGA